jgi:hypothetical protein
MCSKFFTKIKQYNVTTNGTTTADATTITTATTATTARYVEVERYETSWRSLCGAGNCMLGVLI